MATEPLPTSLPTAGTIPAGVATVGAYLAWLRKRQRYGLHDVCTQAGIGQRTLRAVEHDQSPRWIVMRVAQVLRADWTIIDRLSAEEERSD